MAAVGSSGSTAAAGPGAVSAGAGALEPGTVSAGETGYGRAVGGGELVRIAEGVRKVPH